MEACNQKMWLTLTDLSRLTIDAKVMSQPNQKDASFDHLKQEGFTWLLSWLSSIGNA